MATPIFDDRISIDTSLIIGSPKTAKPAVIAATKTIPATGVAVTDTYVTEEDARAEAERFVKEAEEANKKVQKLLRLEKERVELGPSTNENYKDLDRNNKETAALRKEIKESASLTKLYEEEKAKLNSPLVKLREAYKLMCLYRNSSDFNFYKEEISALDSKIKILKEKYSKEAKQFDEEDKSSYENEYINEVNKLLQTGKITLSKYLEQKQNYVDNLCAEEIEEIVKVKAEEAKAKTKTEESIESVNNKKTLEEKKVKLEEIKKEVGEIYNTLSPQINLYEKIITYEKAKTEWYEKFWNNTKKGFEKGEEFNEDKWKDFVELIKMMNLNSFNWTTLERLYYSNRNYKIKRLSCANYIGSSFIIQIPFHTRDNTETYDYFKYRDKGWINQRDATGLISQRIKEMEVYLENVPFLEEQMDPNNQKKNNEINSIIDEQFKAYDRCLTEIQTYLTKIKEETKEDSPIGKDLTKWRTEIENKKETTTYTRKYDKPDLELKDINILQTTHKTIATMVDKTTQTIVEAKIERDGTDASGGSAPSAESDGGGSSYIEACRLSVSNANMRYSSQNGGSLTVNEDYYNQMAKMF